MNRIVPETVEAWADAERLLDRDAYEPGAAELAMSGPPHVVRDAINEVILAAQRNPGKSVSSLAIEVFDEHVDSVLTPLEYVTLRGAGRESLEADGVPAELMLRYRRDPTATTVVMGFLTFVSECFEKDPGEATDVALGAWRRG